MPLPLKHFYIIRHGETVANRDKIMAGHMDTPLTDKGRAQATQTHEIFKNLKIKPKRIIHSSLSRARDTARIINEVLGLPMSEKPDFCEHHVGDWTGKAFKGENPVFSSDKHPPNGETIEEFCTRIQRAMNSALAIETTPPLIVCHGGVFRALGKFYKLDIRKIENCQLYEFTPDKTMPDFPWQVREHLNDGTVILSQSFHT